MDTSTQIKKIYRALAAAIFSFFLVAAACAGEPKQLDDYVWKNRLLLISLDSSEQLDVMQHRLTELKIALNERKLLVFILHNGKIIQGQSEQKVLAETLIADITQSLQNQPKSMLLIGLDGGVKGQYPPNVNSLELMLSDIDMMPMRQLELRR